MKIVPISVGFVLALGTIESSPVLAQGQVSIERGLQVAIVGGCHSCHTEGYSEANGKVDPAKAMKGSSVGFRGPWGTTYATNLRQIARLLKEDGFVIMMKHMQTDPPMPWYNVQAMDESDVRSLYQYIMSLGEPGEPAPQQLPPDQEPKTPYIQFAPPQMPKG